MEDVVKKLIVGSDTETLSTILFTKIDNDGDGKVQQAEVGKAYTIAGRKFLVISKTIEQMGPMLAMFGGGVDMGGGMKTEFYVYSSKIELPLSEKICTRQSLISVVLVRSGT